MASPYGIAYGVLGHHNQNACFLEVNRNVLNQKMLYGLTVMWTVLYSFTWLGISVLNLVIAMKMCLTKFRNQGLPLRGVVSRSTADDKEQKASILLGVISVVSSAIALPDIVYSVMFLDHGFMPLLLDKEGIFLKQLIEVPLYLINSSMNLILFLIVGQSFRQHCMDFFRKCLRHCSRCRAIGGTDTHGSA